MKKIADLTGNKKIAFNMLANIISYSTTVLISFVLTPYLINNLGKEAYSFYPLTNNIISYMSVVMGALNAMASRYITIALAKGENERANQYFSSVFFSNLIIVGVLSVPVIIFIIFIDQVLSVPVNLLAAVRILFALSAASTMVNISFSVFGVATFAKNRIDLRSLRELCMSVLRIVLFVLLFCLFQPSIIYVGVVALVVALVGFCFQFYYTKTLLPEITITLKNFRFSYIKGILTSSVWNTINSLGNTLLSGAALIMANMFYGATAAAEYAIVQTVPVFLNGVISMLTGVFYPVIMNTYATGDKNALLREIKKSQVMVGFFATSVIGVFTGMSFYFFQLWTPGENATWLVMLTSIIIIPRVLVGCMWSLSNVSVAMNKVKTPALYLLTSGVLNVVLAYLCYRYTSIGIVSIPVLFVLIQIVWAGVFFPLYIAKELQVSWVTFYPPIARGFVATAVGLVLACVATSIVDVQSWLVFFIVGGCVGGATLCVNACIMLDKKTLQRLVQLVINKMKRNK